jgi:hypothetical protein
VPGVEQGRRIGRGADYEQLAKKALSFAAGRSRQLLE